jgi:GTP-binding protein
MRVISAEFVTSANTPNQYPSERLPEIAFAGRSNVGKSSLINTLLVKKRLVKTSSKPGCTRLINFFQVNGSFFFTDLPGYGYAKVAMSIRKQWGPMVENYLSKRQTLKAIVLVMDIRRGPEIEEINLFLYLHKISLPVIPVLTKADKLSKSNQKVQKGRTVNVFAENHIHVDPVLFSSKSRQGKDHLWERISVFLPMVEA